MDMKKVEDSFEFSPLWLACRQLEIQGYCPYEKNNVLVKRFPTCPTAQEHGVFGCHACIKDYVETDYLIRTGELKCKKSYKKSHKTIKA